jgi:hypothetical protein
MFDSFVTRHFADHTAILQHSSDRNVHPPSGRAVQISVRHGVNNLPTVLTTPASLNGLPAGALIFSHPALGQISDAVCPGERQLGRQKSSCLALFRGAAADWTAGNRNASRFIPDFSELFTYPA